MCKEQIMLMQFKNATKFKLNKFDELADAIMEAIKLDRARVFKNGEEIKYKLIIEGETRRVVYRDNNKIKGIEIDEGR